MNVDNIFQIIITAVVQGITEFLSKKSKVMGNEVMLIYNKKLSVSPMTTHISINKISKTIKKTNIVKKVKI